MATSIAHSTAAMRAWCWAVRPRVSIEQVPRETSSSPLMEFEVPTKLLDYQCKWDDDEGMPSISKLVNAAKTAAGGGAPMKDVPDEYGILLRLPVLALAHQRITSCFESSTTSPNEAGLRRGFEDILHVVFQRELKAGDHTFTPTTLFVVSRTQASPPFTVYHIDLNAPSGYLRPIPYRDLPSPRAMFDLGVAVTSPDLSGVEIAPEAMYSSRREDIFWQDELDWLISMILFPTEMKKTDQSEHLGRLLFDLSTSFHHLTALGLDVFEMYRAVCASGTVDVHVMRKKNLKVHAMSQNALASYDLREALGVLKCYTFLCRLRDHLRSSIVEKFLDLTPEMVLEAIDKSDQPWRAPSKVRGEVPPANKDTSGHGANGGGERASGEVGERRQGGEAGGGGEGGEGREGDDGRKRGEGGGFQGQKRLGGSNDDVRSPVKKPKVGDGGGMVRADAGSPSSNEPVLDDSILSWVRSSVAGGIFDKDQDEDGGASPAHDGGSHGEGVSPLACADDERESDQYVAPIEWADMVPTTKWMEQVDSWETERDSYRAVGGLPLTRENASRLPPRRPVTDDTRDSVSLSSD